MIETPYLLFLGDAPDALAAKVAQGIKDWRPENCVGQFRMEGCKADLKLPDMTLEDAKAAGAKTLVIGVANRGGVISAAWKKVLVMALEEGFDLASGLHNLLRDEPDLVAVAEEDAKAATEERDVAERNELLRMLGADDGGRLPPALRSQVKQLEEDQKRRATRHKRDVFDRAIVDLLSLYRDVSCVQVGAEVPLVNESHRGHIEKLAERTTLADTMRCLDALALTRERLAGNVAPLLALEAMALALRPRTAA